MSKGWTPAALPARRGEHQGVRIAGVDVLGQRIDQEPGSTTTRC